MKKNGKRPLLLIAFHPEPPPQRGQFHEELKERYLFEKRTSKLFAQQIVGSHPFFLAFPITHRLIAPPLCLVHIASCVIKSFRAYRWNCSVVVQRINVNLYLAGVTRPLSPLFLSLSIKSSKECCHGFHHRRDPLTVRYHCLMA